MFREYFARAEHISTIVQGTRDFGIDDKRFVVRDVLDISNAYRCQNIIDNDYIKSLAYGGLDERNYIIATPRDVPDMQYIAYPVKILEYPGFGKYIDVTDAGVFKITGRHNMTKAGMRLTVLTLEPVVGEVVSMEA